MKAARLQIILIVLVGLAVGVYALSMYRGTAGGPNEAATSTVSGFTDFASDHIGISLRYPDTYTVESRHEGNAEREWHTLVFLPKGYVPPVGGEGPATITISDFPNSEGLPLEQWVRGDARSNFKLSPDQKLTGATVGSQPALGYQHSGLYETDAVAVASNGKVYLFSAGWQGPSDPTRGELIALLDTVRFSVPQPN